MNYISQKNSKAGEDADGDPGIDIYLEKTEETSIS